MSLRAIAPLMGLWIPLAALDLAVAQGPVLSGQVQDSAAAGIAGVDIDLFDANTLNEYDLSQDFTGLDGTYELTVLEAIPSGLYDLHFRPPAGSHFFSLILEDVFIAGDTDIGVTTLESGFFVSGRVVNGGGSGLLAVDLDLLGPGGVPFDASGDVTDATGAFSVLVPPDVYHIEFRSTDVTPGGPYVPVRLNDQSVFADVSLDDIVLLDGYTLTGVVQNLGGNPVVGADIDVRDLSTNAEVFTEHDNTDGAGAFSVLAPLGAWNIEIDPPQGALLVTEVIAFTIEMAGNDLGTVVLEDGFSVTGTTVDSGLNAVPDVDLDFVISTTQEEIPTAHDNANSRGQFTVVVPGNTYDIEFRPPFSSGRAPLVLRQQAIFSNTPLGAVILPAGFAITGSVTSGGNPVTGVEVSLTDSATGLPVYTFGNETDALGDYAIRQVGGTYDVRFTPPAGSGFLGHLETAVELSQDITIDVDLSGGFRGFIRGDVDFDAVLNGITDGLYLLSYVFVPGSPEPPCLDAADADDSGDINGLTDGLYLLAFQFIPGSPPPPAPFPLAGNDPTPDGLGCL